MKIETKLAASDSEIQAAYAIRRAVFIEEQGMTEEEEFDELDKISKQLIAIAGGKIIGTARLTPTGATARLSRLAVLKEFRKFGVGSTLVEFCLKLCKSSNVILIWLNAETYAEKFYSRFGFVREGDEFKGDGGIPHIRMARR